MASVDLSTFNNTSYKAKQNKLKQLLWYLVNMVFFNSYIFPFSNLKCGLMRFFGAKVGIGVVIKPKVNIKYPWNLEIGDHCWIGEEVWMDSLDYIVLKNSVCVSQGAYLLTGNHDYTISSFDLITKPIVLENGVWIGAKSIVIPGTIAEQHAVLSVGSVSPKHMLAHTIYRGNPAQAVKTRTIHD